MARNLRDTPFSIERLPIWALGISLFFSVLGMIAMALLGIEIPRPIQNFVSFVSGAFVTIIVGNRKPPE